MNCCLIIVDSLRADTTTDLPSGSFFDRLSAGSCSFTRAYATECWTLPSHMSMFTGLLPSEHGAHFQSMSYNGSAPTIAEILAREGFHTEVVTRNSIFDGTLPGVVRGFQYNTAPLADTGGLNLMSAVLALSKPRFRRQIDTTGFFHPLQRESREFLTRFARATVPADRKALEVVADRIRCLRKQGKPFFIFANLYDVHAPYPPVEESIFRSVFSKDGVAEALRMPFVLPRLGGHAYLAPGFSISLRSRELLRGRYRDAVSMMSDKLSDFYSDLEASGALDDTLVIVTSDHGEAFGEHGLYLHDSSVWQTHLHVPLYVHHPDVEPGRIDDTVSLSDLFGLIRGVTLTGQVTTTILDEGYRKRNPVAVAQHYYSPRAVGADPKFLQNQAAAICGDDKIIVRPGETLRFNLADDGEEQRPVEGDVEGFCSQCLRNGAPQAAVANALGRVTSELPA